MRFHSQNVLVPSANGELIREGTGMPQSHLDIALALQKVRDRATPEAFSRLLRLREFRIRRLARERFEQEVAAVENLLGHKFL